FFFLDGDIAEQSFAESEGLSLGYGIGEGSGVLQWGGAGRAASVERDVKDSSVLIPLTALCRRRSSNVERRKKKGLGFIFTAHKSKIPREITLPIKNEIRPFFLLSGRGYC
ncbi:MAG: hypothetical protein ACYTG7_22395, partial [Planctomycetota bacterium]